MEVQALYSMRHISDRTRGERFHVSPRHAQQLAAKGLVKIVGGAPANPPKAAGAPSSASPVAPASPQTTRKRSTGGARKKTAAPSLL